MSAAMHLCVCLYVCKCMRKYLDLYETPIYFRYIDYLLIILLQGLFMMRDMHMSFNFGEEILIIDGDSPKWVLQLFWWVQAFGLL